MEQRVVHIHTLFIINICSFFLHKSTEIEHFSNKRLTWGIVMIGYEYCNFWSIPLSLQAVTHNFVV